MYLLISFFSFLKGYFFHPFSRYFRGSFFIFFNFCCIQFYFIFKRFYVYTNLIIIFRWLLLSFRVRTLFWFFFFFYFFWLYYFLLFFFLRLLFMRTITLKNIKLLLIHLYLNSLSILRIKSKTIRLELNYWIQTIMSIWFLLNKFKNFSIIWIIFWKRSLYYTRHMWQIFFIINYLW